MMRANHIFINKVYDLPADILETLQRKEEADSDLSQHTTTIVSKDIVSEDEVNTTSVSGSKACSLCNLNFYTLEDQRSHTRSDIHGYNLRQKLKGLKSVSESEFDQLAKGMGKPSKIESMG
jgi:hypothetical protein